MAKRKDNGAGFDWKNFVTYLSSFCILAVLAALLVGAVVGMRPLEAKAATLASGNEPQLKIIWPKTGRADGSTWLPKTDQNDLLGLAHSAMGADARVYSRIPLERVSTSLMETGWFNAPPLVRREPGSVVVVEGSWRIPGAVVRHGGRDHLISWDAKPMPSVYAPGEAKGLRFILDPVMGPPQHADGSRDYATPWAGEDIAASLELLELMVEKPWARQVAGIDASSYSADGKLTIVTPEQTRVVWGGRVSRPLIGEVSTAQKLAHLSQLMHDFKRIDANHSLIYINSNQLLFDVSATASTPDGPVPIASVPAP